MTEFGKLNFVLNLGLKAFHVLVYEAIVMLRRKQLLSSIIVCVLPQCVCEVGWNSDSVWAVNVGMKI